MKFYKLHQKAKSVGILVEGLEPKDDGLFLRQLKETTLTTIELVQLLTELKIYEYEVFTGAVLLPDMKNFIEVQFKNEDDLTLFLLNI